MRGLFITGTDTSIGKTVVAAAITSILAADAQDVVPVKPVQTGCVAGESGLSAPDLEFCLRMAGMAPERDPGEALCPFKFESACSPHLAAEQKGARLCAQAVADAVGRIAQQHEILIVEGAGGILVPLNTTETMLNLMQTLDLPVVLVARSGLGTINHTLLSLRALRDAGCRLAGVVINDCMPTDHGPIERDNRQVIESMGEIPAVLRLPHLKGLDAMDPGAFQTWARQHFPEIGTWIGSSRETQRGVRTTRESWS